MRMERIGRQALFPVAILLLGSSLLGQQASERVDVVLVEVPVQVVDRGGSPIRGLTAENFEILDEGMKLPISHFEAIDFSVPVPKQDRHRWNPAARRNFLLVFDFSYSSPGTLDRAGGAARQFIRDSVGERDLVGIATFSVENGFDWITSFTSDRKTLLKAIEALGTSKMVDAADPLALSVFEPTGFGTGADQSARNERSQEVDESQRDIARRMQGSNEEIQRARIRHQFLQFGRLAKILDRIRGPKQVILLSEGFDARLLQGRSSSSHGEQEDFSSAVHGEVWNIDNDQRFGNTAAVRILDQMATLFRRSDVVLHAIDIKGLRSEVDARMGYQASSADSLFLMANPTGGRLFKNTNDLAETFDRMLRQHEVVYVLGFQVPSPGSPGKFHNLKVRLRDVVGARVHHRAGYYEPSAMASPLERTLSAVEILMNDIAQEAVAIDMIAAPFPSEIGNPQVPVILEIAGPSMLEGAPGKQLEGEIFVYAFDRDYAVRDFLYHKVQFDLTKTRERLLSSGLKFYGSLNLPPGAYDIKVLVRVAQTGRLGFERVAVEVPDFSGPAVLPPLVVGDAEDWILLKAAPRRPAEVDYPFTLASESFVPKAGRLLEPGQAYEIALFGWHVEPEGLELAVKVTHEDGTQWPANIVLVGRTPGGSPGPAKLLFNFKPEGLPAGRYGLDFTIRPSGHPYPYQVSVPFVLN